VNGSRSGVVGDVWEGNHAAEETGLRKCTVLNGWLCCDGEMASMEGRKKRNWVVFSLAKIRVTTRGSSGYSGVLKGVHAGRKACSHKSGKPRNEN